MVVSIVISNAQVSLNSECLFWDHINHFLYQTFKLVKKDGLNILTAKNLNHGNSNSLKFWWVKWKNSYCGLRSFLVLTNKWIDNLKDKEKQKTN